MILIDGIIYFLNTPKIQFPIYDDGVVLGSIIGGIDLKTMKTTFTEKI
jgi:hypothetical protein